MAPLCVAQGANPEVTHDNTRQTICVYWTVLDEGDGFGAVEDVSTDQKDVCTVRRLDDA